MFRKNYLFLLSFLLLAVACRTESETPFILVSREYGNSFMNWLARADNSIKRINMYTLPEDSIGYYLERADGIIISGGPDVNPAVYGKASELDRCEAIDYRRDSLEFKMIDYAMDHKIPLLGICRGHQILNVAGKGTLIVDIPTDYDTVVSHRQEGLHPVHVERGTLLFDIVGLEKGEVNSRHHQAVEKLAPGFRASALAPDGIIEAIELEDRSGHPFVLGLQWHPESMIRDSDSPFAFPIAIRFMDAVHQSMR